MDYAGDHGDTLAAMALARSTELRPDHPHTEAALEPVLADVPVLAFAHTFRAGSALRLWVPARSGGDRRAAGATTDRRAPGDRRRPTGRDVRRSRAGDVQWMTAASGILHKEYHEENWAREGGTFQMMQLWVNLPAAHKMDPPGYQPLTAEQMGHVDLADGAGTIRIIAGEYHGVRGPARTMTPINLWDVTLEAGAAVELSFPEHQNTALFVLDGTAVINGTKVSPEGLVVFENDGTDILAETDQGSRLLLLNGEPIDEPVVSHGPFVMNTRDEIVQAANDFNSGKFGHLV